MTEEKAGLSWKFKPEKREVKISGYYDEPIKFEWLEPKYGDLQAFKYELDRITKAYAILGRALQAISTGNAGTYEDALKEVKYLIDETNEAAGEVLECCATVNQWFPQTLTTLFDEKGDVLVQFCREFIAANMHPEQVRKNSSRGQSEKLTDLPPETAPTASDSSSTETEALPVPASTKTKESPEKKTA